MQEQKPIKKTIPSKLETGFQQFLYQHVGPHIPSRITPNQMTLIGALGGVLAIVCTLLTHFSPFFFLGTLAGLLIHLVADDLDGYIARSRSMGSKAGAYFDLITDVMFSTFLLLAFGLSPYASIEVMAFAAPLYGIINVTAMNYILYCREFLFPRLGPIEAHLTYGIIALLSMLLPDKPLWCPLGLELRIADLLMLAGLVPMYYEMFRLQVQLFRRLKEQDNG